MRPPAVKRVFCRPVTLSIILLLMSFTILTALLGATSAESSEIEDLISFSLSYELPGGGSESGEAILSLAIHIEEGFPVHGKRFVVEQVLIILKQLWGEEDHDDVLQNTVTSQVPSELRSTSRGFNGTELLIMLFDQFNSIEDRGLLYFDETVDLVYAESLSYYPDLLINDYPVLSDSMSQGMVNFVLGDVADVESRHRIIKGNLVNLSAAVLSFRSEHLVFPLDLGELEASGHLLVELFNPFTGAPAKNIVDDADIRPGDLRYEYVDSERVAVLSYLEDGSIVRRAIDLYSSEKFDTLYTTVQERSDEDREVAIYIFQLSHILNEYYHEFGVLPDKAPRIESGLFASVSFANPYSNLPVKQLVNLLETSPGDYFYYRISDNQYSLIGYSDDGSEVLKIQRKLTGFKDES